MDDVDRIGAPAEPRPKVRWLVHALAEDEQPRGDQAPGDEGFPEGIEKRVPGQAAGIVGIVRAVQCAGNRADNRHAGPGDDERPDPWTRMIPTELPQPVVTPGGNAHRKEEDIAGEVAELEAKDHLAHGYELAKGECGNDDSQRAYKPPTISGDWPGRALGLGQRSAESDSPGAVNESEDQEGLREPERAVDELLVLPEVTDGGPETVALRESHERCGQRAQDQAECQQGQAEPEESVADEASIALALQRSRREIAGQQEQEAHVIGLIGRTERGEQQAGERTGGLAFVVKPAA